MTKMDQFTIFTFFHLNAHFSSLLGRYLLLHTMNSWGVSSGYLRVWLFERFSLAIWNIPRVHTDWFDVTCVHLIAAQVANSIILFNPYPDSVPSHHHHTILDNKYLYYWTQLILLIAIIQVYRRFPGPSSGARSCMYSHWRRGASTKEMMIKYTNNSNMKHKRER